MDKKVRLEILGTSIALVLILLIIGAAVIKKFTPSKEIMNLTEYYQLNADEAAVILQDRIYDKNGLFKNGNVYLDYDTVTGLFNKRFYWDNNEKILSYTTPTQVIKAEPDSSTLYINEESQHSDYPVVVLQGNTVYIAVEFMKQYSDMRYEQYENPNRIVIQYNWGDYLFTKVKKNTQLRYEPSIKSDILYELKPGDVLTYVDTNAVAENGFSKVMTQDGIIGYVRNKYVDESYYDAVKSDYKEPEYTHIRKEETVNLVWHQVTNRDANANLSNHLNKTRGVNTISPTWFKIIDDEGTLSSLGDKNYVEQAHSLGVSVWALVDDFSRDVSMLNLLSHTSKREKLIGNLMENVNQYGLDGINIDFENVTEEAGIHYIQFIRELSVKCREKGIILSIDNYVPSSYTAYYDREEQGMVADYVIIMAYDEHHAGSNESGSVSSIGFVENAIHNILEMVPEDGVIIGIPFYTRLWKETKEENGSLLVTSQAYGMSKAQEILKDNAATPQWDRESGQYYAEYEKDDAFYRIWLEEEESIETKLKAIDSAGIAGIACWKLGLEKQSIWDVINKYIN